MLLASSGFVTFTLLPAAKLTVGVLATFTLAVFPTFTVPLTGCAFPLKVTGSGTLVTVTGAFRHQGLEC